MPSWSQKNVLAYMTGSDGLRTFDYAASNRIVKVYKDGEAASINYHARRSIVFASGTAID